MENQIIPHLLGSNINIENGLPVVRREFLAENEQHFNPEMNGFRIEQGRGFMKPTEVAYLEPALDLFYAHFGLTDDKIKKINDLERDLRIERKENYFVFLNGKTVIELMGSSYQSEDLVTNAKLRLRKNFSLETKFVDWKKNKGFTLGFYVPSSTDLLFETSMYNHDRVLVRKIMTSSQIYLESHCSDENPNISSFDELNFFKKEIHEISSCLFDVLLSRKRT